MMEMKDELMMKFLLNETSTEENIEIENWLNTNATNQKYFENMKLIWESSKLLALNDQIDEHKLWVKFKIRAQIRATKRASIQTYSWLKIAAVIFLISGISWLSYQQFKTPELIKVQTLGETKIINLPDGSVVTLNKYSSINYPERFKDNIRNIRIINGEAFFTVSPNKSKPFVINTINSLIRVVGTSFNVKCNHEKTEVIVETGIVKVSKNTSFIDLKPGEKVVVNNDDDSLEKQRIADKFYNYYITKELVANGTPLWRVVEALNEAYGMNIIIEKEEIKNLKLTSTFKNESVVKILNVIADTFQLQIVRKNNQIILL